MEPRHGATVGSYGVAFFSERGTAVQQITSKTRDSKPRKRPRLSAQVEGIKKVPSLDDQGLQGYLARKKQTLTLGPPYDPRYIPTVGSYEGGVSYKRGTPVEPSFAPQP